MFRCYSEGNRVIYEFEKIQSSKIAKFSSECHLRKICIIQCAPLEGSPEKYQFKLTGHFFCKIK
jgi:hypothetical protein